MQQMDQVTEILILILGMVFSTLLLRRRERNRFSTFMLWVIFLIYLCGNLYFTLFSRTVGSIARIEQELLSNYKKALAFDGGFIETFYQLLTEGLPALERIRIQSMTSAREIILNILLYIPMGYMLPLLFEAWKAKKVIRTGFLASLLTESIQLMFRLGEFSFSDLLNNTLGTIIGFGGYLLVFRVIWKMKQE